MNELTENELLIIEGMWTRFPEAKIHLDERGATILETPDGSVDLLWEDREGDLYFEINARESDGNLIPIEIEIRQFNPTAQEADLFFSLLRAVQVQLGC